MQAGYIFPPPPQKFRDKARLILRCLFYFRDVASTWEAGADYVFMDRDCLEWTILVKEKGFCYRKPTR